MLRRQGESATTSNSSCRHSRAFWQQNAQQLFPCLQGDVFAVSVLRNVVNESFASRVVLTLSVLLLANGKMKMLRKGGNNGQAVTTKWPGVKTSAHGDISGLGYLVVLKLCQLDRAVSLAKLGSYQLMPVWLALA